MEGEEVIGKRFIIYNRCGSEAAWVHTGLEKEQMRGGSCQKVSGVPSVPCPAAGPCPCCLHQAVPELQQMHLHPMPGCPIRAVVCGDITHLELILMPVVDLRAGDTTWVSSASTDWRRSSFTMYWLLLVGCHSTPKILKKEKKGEKNATFSLFPSPQVICLLSISSKRAFQTTVSSASLAKCRKGKSGKAQPLPRWRRQRQVRTTARGCSCRWLLWGDGLVTLGRLSLSLQGGVTLAQPQKERGAGNASAWHG